MNTSSDKQSFKSRSYDASDNRERVEKSIQGSGSLEPQNEAHKLQINGNTNTQCSDISIYSQELEDLPWQQSNLGEYRQLSLLKSTPMLKQSCDRISQEYQFTQTFETTSHEKESSTLSQWDSPALAHQTQEQERDSSTQPHLFGERDLDVLLKLNPASVLSSSLKELSDEDFELFLGDSLWQDTLGKLRQSRRESLGRVIKDSDYLSFPTLTSNAGSMSRPAGQTKCEKWFKDKGLIPRGSQLGTRAIALAMGFPSDWFEGLAEQYWNKTSTQSQVKPQAESELDISQDEQLHQDKQRSPSAESSTSTQLLGGDKNSPLSTKSSSSLKQNLSIPCLVKQPKQAEVKGFIRKDEGDRFLVDVDGDEISISKLFVYPDLDNCSSKIAAAEQSKKVLNGFSNCSSKTTPPSKRRRHKGEGSGHIYYRTVTRNGKDYRQAYYQWRENGKQRTKYIPKKLLSRVEEAEAQKLPVSEILVLLGGMEKCSSKSSSTSNAPIKKKVVNDSDKCSSKVTPPSKSRRTKGKGSGWIECKPIKRSGKEYKQYWYHYEEWREGNRITKKSKYISKAKRSQVKRMNDEKVSVEEILKVLKDRSKRK